MSKNLLKSHWGSTLIYILQHQVLPCQNYFQSSRSVKTTYYVRSHKKSSAMSEFQLNVQKHVNICCCSFNKMSIKKNVNNNTFWLEIDRYIGLAYISADIWVLPTYRYRPKRPILSASVRVDKTLLYSTRIQTICARKHNEASLDSYLSTLASAVS